MLTSKDNLEPKFLKCSCIAHAQCIRSYLQEQKKRQKKLAFETWAYQTPLLPGLRNHQARGLLPESCLCKGKQVQF